MRLRPTLLLLLLLAVPLSGAATDPGAREPLEPDGDRTVTAGTLATDTGRIVFGTTDPGDNNIVGSTGAHDEPTWFLFDPAGEAEFEAGGVDPVVCSDAQGIGSGDDCETDVAFVASDAAGGRIAAAGVSEKGAVITFTPVEGSPAIQELPGALEIRHFDMNRQGTVVALTYRVGVSDDSWRVMHFDWTDSDVSRWDQPAPLDEPPTGMDLSPDGAVLVVSAGEAYLRYGTATHAPLQTDNQFIGTGQSVAVAADDKRTSVMGTSSGRLTFHDSDSPKNDQVLNFKRQSSPINQVAITDDGATVAWSNRAGTFGVGTYAAATTIFQVLHEVELGAEAQDIAFDRDGRHVAVLAKGQLHLFAIHGSDVHHLWTDEGPGTLVKNPTVSISDDGETLLLARPDGVRVYDAIHDLNVTGDQPTLVPGQEGQLTLRFRNDGNRLAAVGLSVASPEGWTLTPDEEEVAVAPGQTVQVAVDVTAPPSAEPGARSLTVITTDAAGQKTEHAVDVTLERVIDWAVGLREGASPTLSVDAGEPGTFRLFVENRGNTPRAPPLRLTVSDTDWKAEFTSGDGTIEPGQRADLDVRVTPPRGALELEEATVTVRLDGFGEPVVLRAVVGAVFGFELDAPPGIEVEDGGSRTFNVTVRNVGNTQDGVRLGFGDLPTGWEGRFNFGLTEVSVKQIPAGAERTVPVTIEVAPGEDRDAPFIVELHATSIGDAGNVTTEEILVTVVEPAPPEEPDNDSPGLPLVGLLAAIGVAFAVRRRN